MASFLLTSLNLVLLYRGTLTTDPGFSISVPEKVFVEINHCVDVPCTFTLPESYSKSSSPLYIYWFMLVYRRHYLRGLDEWALGTLAVTNDSRQKTRISNLTLIGDPQNGDCSFNVANAQPVGWMKYYMKINKGPGFSHEFGSSGKNPEIVVTALKKPVIWKPPSIIWGENINFSCVASNCCLKHRPQILWSSKSSRWNTSDWSTQTSAWTWTYGTNLSFTPILAHEGLILTCKLKYPDRKEHLRNAVQLHMAYSPQIMVIHHCKYDHNSTTVCSCAFHSWPPPEVQWYINHHQLTKKNISDYVRIISSTQGNTVTSSLHLPGNALNAYIITCRAMNPMGFSNLKTLAIPANMTKGVKMKQNRAQLPAILLGTLVTLLILMAVLYYFYSPTEGKMDQATQPAGQIPG